MKKVLFILHWPPPVHGSSVMGLHIKNSKLIKESFNADYINLTTSQNLSEIGKLSIMTINKFFKIFISVISKNIIKKYDLCYMAITINGKAFYKDVFIVFILKIFKTNLVFHLHNKGASTYSNFIRKKLYSYVFNNTSVILLSKYLYPDIQNYVNKSQIHICPNGIPNIKIENICECSRGNTTVNILFLSNMIESKGVFVLLDACQLLKKKGLRFHCIFVGGWADVNKDSFDAQVIQNGLQNFVTYEGIKYDAEKWNYYLKSDIFAFPTFYHNEAFSLVIIESMQFSLPVVTTYEGGIPDIVKDGITGFLIPPKDVKVLAEKLELLIKTPNIRQKMGNAGFARYKNKFTIQHFENNLKNILNQIINENH